MPANSFASLQIHSGFECVSDQFLLPRSFNRLTDNRSDFAQLSHAISCDRIGKRFVNFGKQFPVRTPLST